MKTDVTKERDSNGEVNQFIVWIRQQYGPGPNDKKKTKPQRNHNIGTNSSSKYGHI